MENQRKSLTNKAIEPKLVETAIVPQEEPEDKDPLKTVRDDLIQAGEQMSAELCKKLRNPKHIRRLDINELLANCTKIVAVLSKPGISLLIPKNLAVNMQQVNNYSNDIANSPTRKKQLREQARKQLKHRPS